MVRPTSSRRTHRFDVVACSAPHELTGSATADSCRPPWSAGPSSNRRIWLLSRVPNPLRSPAGPWAARSHGCCRLIVLVPRGIGYRDRYPIAVVARPVTPRRPPDRRAGSVGAPTPAQQSSRAQQSNTDQQMSFRNRWSSRTSSRIASGSWSRCHRHSSRPAVSPSPSGAAARAALIA